MRRRIVVVVVADGGGRGGGGGGATLFLVVAVLSAIPATTVTGVVDEVMFLDLSESRENNKPNRVMYVSPYRYEELSMYSNDLLSCTTGMYFFGQGRVSCFVNQSKESVHEFLLIVNKLCWLRWNRI